MRIWTLEEVRELLSSAGAMSFFERWSAAAAARDRLAERIDDLKAQGVMSLGRARLAEERAKASQDRAELQRRRLHFATGSAGEVVRLEAEALVGAALAEAEGAAREAAERTSRAQALEADAAGLKGEVETSDRTLDKLWGEAGGLGAHVGESCLFFASSEVAGGYYVVPLVQLALRGATLEAFVLHRLPAATPLDGAAPIRDRPEEEEGGGAGELFETPQEAPPGRNAG